MDDIWGNYFLWTYIGEGISIFLMLMLILRHILFLRNNKTERRLFFVLVVQTIQLAVVNIFSYFAWQQIYPDVNIGVVLGQMLCDILRVILIVSWLIGVKYYIDGSIDNISRHIGRVFAPALIGLLLLITYEIIYISAEIHPQYIDIVERMSWLLKLGGIIEISYILYAYYLLKKARIKNGGIPMLLRITPFVLPVFLGVLITEFTGYTVSSLGIAIGLCCMDIFLTKRRRCYNDETGFYRADYINFLAAYGEKGTQFAELIVVFRLRATQFRVFGPILYQWAPLDSKVIETPENNCYVLLSKKQDKMVTEKLIELIKEDAKGNGIMVDSFYIYREKNDTVDDITNKFRNAFEQGLHLEQRSERIAAAK